MNIAQRFAGGQSGGLSIVDAASELGCFLDRDCAGAILRRQMPPDIAGWLAALDPDNLPRGRVVVQPHAVADIVGHLCDMSEVPSGRERAWLQADIADQADAFAALMQARYLRVRLDVITTNACRRFHVDAIKARLVCTYRGTGTQYGFATADAHPDRIFTVQTGSPILLRGSLWPARPASNLVHRSPPIEGTGETRLVLVLDVVDDPDGDD